ncbi:hypothetical protein G8770_06495 [Aestuariicella hydrocarbonica]|uniref:Uncharacterized protein n=1 Tax=Pseudomaricurvus hydrocarbonicus TaxID=1470433 RepID=A0A9E5JV95_9GAMM|nr:hypothetical protein [Aestuariicella hydrocarbonica]NHO65190.1 hypothetical protein [Aestuariicella hydrocarbonica]
MTALRLCLITALSATLLVLVSCSDQLSQPTDTEASAESQPPVETPPARISFSLGNMATLSTLYSYPNSSNGESLEATIEHYLNQRLSRDQIANGVADVTVTNNTYSVTLSGNSPHLATYQTQLTHFLNNGELAANAVTQLKQAGKWDDQNWRFFLPLGLSIVNQRSVQLLHFPPDYSLPEQDYLNSKTSQRWEKLLTLNSVAADEVTLYESILDVAPIAAPASAGSTLTDTYPYFEPYVVSMLPLLLKTELLKTEQLKEELLKTPAATRQPPEASTTTALPIVAYGGPVRNWVSSYYQLNDFGVNSVSLITVTEGVTAPILGANHPSYIWYAKEQGRAAAMKVMQQDLISACWQANQAKAAAPHPTETLNNCTGYWQNRPMTVCINMEIQAFDQTAAEAKALCAKDLPQLHTAVLTDAVLTKAALTEAAINTTVPTGANRALTF